MPTPTPPLPAFIPIPIGNVRSSVSLAPSRLRDQSSSRWASRSTAMTVDPKRSMIHARVAKLRFGARNPKYGACGSVVNLLEKGRWNHEIAVDEGVLKDDAALILQEFFRSKRMI